MFDKSNRKQWRNKRRNNWIETQTSEGPGDIVSSSKLVWPITGFISQMTGILTRKRYKNATVYVDQYSGLVYTYLHKSSDADETIQGNKDFEK